ncbi:MAG: hypothetical protein KatS3mg131_2335 [Candidatus Tectimicrobiota bacterium]|nr:MAG: hypothetical protein KatS3mg131_2335 [Candidatus Tectomicrobia bacterium]
MRRVTFGILILFYYRQRLKTGKNPDFIEEKSSQNPELHKYLRACYRVIIDGSVGRIGQVAERTIAGQYNSLKRLPAMLIPLELVILTTFQCMIGYDQT